MYTCTARRCGTDPTPYRIRVRETKFAGMSLHWLKTRWRTRGEYAVMGRRLLWRFGLPIAGSLAVGALILFGVFWVLSSPSRSGARHVRIDALADSVVGAVERGRPARPVSLDDLVAAGVLTAADVEFLEEEGVRFEPFHAGSPDTAAVFRRTGAGEERVHRKDGSEDYYSFAASPDDRYVVVVGPPPRGSQGAADMRSVTVRSVADGSAPSHVLHSMLVPSYGRAHWSPDSRFVAIEARPADSSRAASRETFVLVVGPAPGAGSLRRLVLPAGVDPAALLEPEDREGHLQSADVRFRSWRGGTLQVESTGHGWVGPPGEPGSRAIHVRCRFDLEISEQGVRELGRRCGS